MIPGLGLAVSAPLYIKYLLAVGGKNKDKEIVTDIHLYQPHWDLPTINGLRARKFSGWRKGQYGRSIDEEN